MSFLASTRHILLCDSIVCFNIVANTLILFFSAFSSMFSSIFGKYLRVVKEKKIQLLMFFKDFITFKFKLHSVVYLYTLIRVKCISVSLVLQATQGLFHTNKETRK